MMKPVMKQILFAFALFIIGTAAVAQNNVLNPQTNASALTIGTLAAARGGAGTITGALKGSGAGVVTQAASADLSDSGAWTPYTPTVTCATSGTITTYSAVGRSKTILSKTVQFEMSISISTIGTCTGNLLVTLPTGVFGTTIYPGNAFNASTAVVLPGSASSSPNGFTIFVAPNAFLYVAGGTYESN